MNIFVLDRDPVIAAQLLCDAHVVKMILESCQLLSTHDTLTHRVADTSSMYKVTHSNHPCRVCLTNEGNRVWLKYHLNALLQEYTFRYGKIHKCSELVSQYWYTPLLWQLGTSSTALGQLQLHIDAAVRQQTLPKCMPEEFKTGGSDIISVVRSYRNYYKYKQQTMKRFRYTRRETPRWLSA